MSDASEEYKALRLESQCRRAEHRAHAIAVLTNRGYHFETRNDGVHLIVEAALGKIDYWPGTGLWKCRYGTQQGRGIASVLQHLSKN